MLPHFFPGPFQQDKGTEQVRHQIFKMAPRTALHLFVRPIGKGDSDVRHCQATVTTEQEVSHPPNELAQTKHPTQRQTSECPPHSAVNKVDQVIENIRRLQPKVTHFSLELSFSREGPQSKKKRLGEHVSGNTYRRIGEASQDARCMRAVPSFASNLEGDRDLFLTRVGTATPPRPYAPTPTRRYADTSSPPPTRFPPRYPLG